jgi:hypothetical protein
MRVPTATNYDQATFISFPLSLAARLKRRGQPPRVSQQELILLGEKTFDGASAEAIPMGWPPGWFSSGAMRDLPFLRRTESQRMNSNKQYILISPPL